MDEFPQDYEVFDLGDVTLQYGATLRDAKLAYKTYGELNADKSNAIVYPTYPHLAQSLAPFHIAHHDGRSRNAEPLPAALSGPRSCAPRGAQAPR
jgi:homoserine acetyltransferase